MASSAAPESELFNHFRTRADELSRRSGMRYKNKKTFIEFCDDSQVRAIIDSFVYPDDSTSSVVVRPSSLVEINAGTFNDYYKFTMAPVIRTVYDDKKCVVQFCVDWRFGTSFNSHMQEYVRTKDGDFKVKLANELYGFSTRMFTREMIDAETNRGPDKGPGYWRKFFKDDKASNWGIFEEKALIASVDDIPKIVQTYSVEKEEGEVDINPETDFYPNTSILKFTPVPKVFDEFPIVVLSIVQADSTDGKPDVRATGNWPMCSWLETPMMQACYGFVHTEYLRRTGTSYGKWMAEALYRTFSGMCFLDGKNIKVALFSGRRTGGALFHLLQVWLWNKFDEPGGPAPSSTGKNLGTSSFWALQTLERLLGITPVINPTGTHAHELSMTLAALYPELDAPATGFVGSQLLGHMLYSEISGGNGEVPLLSDTVGTANFLKTACALQIPGFLRKGSETNCLHRFLAARQDSGKLHDYKLLMMIYSLLSDRATCPMLMASEIDDRTLDFIRAILLGIQLAGVGGALGDSEKIDAQTIFGTEFTCRHEGHDDTMNDEQYKAFIGSLNEMNPNNLHFAASMAVKIVCVFVPEEGGVRRTLKTGDAKGKLTFDPAAPDKGALKEKGEQYQVFHTQALETAKELAPGLMHKFEEIESYMKEYERILQNEGQEAADSLPQPNPSDLQEDYKAMKSLGLDLTTLPHFKAGDISVDIQEKFEELLRNFAPEEFKSGAAAVQGSALGSARGSGDADIGGRRTRRKGRKVSKKYVRKNIRKSKNKKSRRSYRRKSKK